MSTDRDRLAMAVAELDKASKLGDLIGFEVTHHEGATTWRGLWGYGGAPDPDATAHGATLAEAMVALVEAVKRL